MGGADGGSLVLVILSFPDFCERAFERDWFSVAAKLLATRSSASECAGSSLMMLASGFGFVVTDSSISFCRLFESDRGDSVTGGSLLSHTRGLISQDPGITCKSVIT